MREITKTNDMKNIHKIKNNIYVTSDEKIKKGDCVINLLSKEVYFITIVNEVVDYEKKIILTDDKNLISNEIQPIDNILKEWFVKNPNCEGVGIKKELIWPIDLGHWAAHYEYKIIIPTE